VDKEGEKGRGGGEEVDIAPSYAPTHCRGGRVYSLHCIELTRRLLTHVESPGFEL
jgi:hypothetical protein